MQHAPAHAHAHCTCTCKVHVHISVCSCMRKLHAAQTVVQRTRHRHEAWPQRYEDAESVGRLTRPLETCDATTLVIVTIPP
eukprot:1276010-Prymnesium_polylepis.1